MSVAGTSSAPTSSAEGTPARARVAALLRYWVAAVWLTNGLAKLFHVSRLDLGFFRAGLIDLDGAHGILRRAVEGTTIQPLAAVYSWVAGSAWPTFGVLLTIGELAIGVAFAVGLFTRVAAVAGLLLIGPVWIMTWPSGTYLWDYPADLIPLGLLVLLPAPHRLRRPRRPRPVVSSTASGPS